MLQNKTQTFNDGIVRIYKLENSATPGDKPVESLVLKKILRYHERTVGINRYYAALKENVGVDLVLRCPEVRGISEKKEDILVAVPEDGLQYKVGQVQFPEDVTPAVMDLSLERLGTDYDI